MRFICQFVLYWRFVYGNNAEDSKNETGE